MAEYSKLASGVVTSNGVSVPVNLPFIPNYIAIENVTRLVAGAGVTSALWMTDMGQGAAVINTFGTGAQYVAPVGQTSSGALVSGTGFSTFQAGLALQYGPTVFLGGSGSITKNSTAPLVTTTAAHGLVPGNVVVFQNLYQTSTTGMQQIAGIPFLVVTAPTTTTFTIAWNTNQSNYTAIATGGLNANASFKQVLYPFLYNPGISFISAISLGATTLVTTTAPHNYVVGQEVAFRIPTLWGTYQLNSLPNVIIPGSPIYGFVTAVTINTVTVNINSALYTAYNSNQLFASFPGEKFPQMAAVGDANSGSLQTNFLSPQFYNGYSLSQVNSINGPAIAGAFFNATFQGFMIGSSAAGTAADIIYWRAYLHDMNS